MKPGKLPLLAALLCFAVSVFGQSAPSEAVSAEMQDAAGQSADFDLLQNREGGVTITAYKGSAERVVIPAEIGGLKVTVIGPRSFYRKDLRSVSIPEGVKTIGYCAFAENLLEGITIPGGVVSIEYEAFSGNRITFLELPETIHSIGVRAFAGNRIVKISVPRVSYIGKDAFSGNSFETITMAENRNLFTSQGFDLSFVNYYISTGKKAGEYIKNGRIWLLTSGME